MASDVVMPALGMAQETGKLTRWLVAEGQPVRKGEPLFEVETDKITVEIEAHVSGVLGRVSAAEGDDVPVGQPIAAILTEAEAANAGSTTLAVAAPQVPERGPSPARQPAANSVADSGRISATPLARRIAATNGVQLEAITPRGDRISKVDVLSHLETKSQAAQRLRPASPLARRIAAEQGLELKTLDGSGPDGAVLIQDVHDALQTARSASVEAPVVQAEPVRPSQAERETADPQARNVLPMNAAWRVMAERLTTSWHDTPHFYLTREVNTRRLAAWRSHLLEDNGPRVTYTDLLVKLVAVSLRTHPRLNASWTSAGIVLNDDVNVGIAVATDDSLLVPVLQQADTLGVRALAARRVELVERAQAGRLRPADIQGGTFTISNLGMYGVDAFQALVNPPQAAILAVGRIADRVVPINGQPAVEPMMTLTLSCDHRIADGARAARFLDTLAKLIEEPLAALD